MNTNAFSLIIWSTKYNCFSLVSESKKKMAGIFLRDVITGKRNLVTLPKVNELKAVFPFAVKGLGKSLHP